MEAARSQSEQPETSDAPVPAPPPHKVPLSTQLVTKVTELRLRQQQLVRKDVPRLVDTYYSRFVLGARRLRRDASSATDYVVDTAADAVTSVKNAGKGLLNVASFLHSGGTVFHIGDDLDDSSDEPEKPVDVPQSEFQSVLNSYNPAEMSKALDVITQAGLVEVTRDIVDPECAAPVHREFQNDVVKHYVTHSACSIDDLYIYGAEEAWKLQADYTWQWSQYTGIRSFAFSVIKGSLRIVNSGGESVAGKVANSLLGWTKMFTPKELTERLTSGHSDLPEVMPDQSLEDHERNIRIIVGMQGHPSLSHVQISVCTGRAKLVACAKAVHLLYETDLSKFDTSKGSNTATLTRLVSGVFQDKLRLRDDIGPAVDLTVRAAVAKYRYTEAQFAGVSGNCPKRN